VTPTARNPSTRTSSATVTTSTACGGTGAAGVNRKALPVRGLRPRYPLTCSNFLRHGLWRCRGWEPRLPSHGGGCG
jgi:hypothetical protein